MQHEEDAFDAHVGSVVAVMFHVGVLPHVRWLYWYCTCTCTRKLLARDTTFRPSKGFVSCLLVVGFSKGALVVSIPDTGSVDILLMRTDSF